MIKKNDVVVDYKGRILHVEGLHKDGAETFVLVKGLPLTEKSCRCVVLR